jgi:hypothetical protein
MENDGAGDEVDPEHPATTDAAAAAASSATERCSSGS